jgi:DnaK suppressor protein
MLPTHEAHSARPSGYGQVKGTKMSDSSMDANPLDPAKRAELLARLQDEWNRLQTMRRSSGEYLQGGDDPGDPLLRDMWDFGDQGQDVTFEETEQALSENDTRLLEQIERALQRMDEGTYGLSEVTGKPIPIERLEALPWATTNVDDPAPQ